MRISRQLLDPDVWYRVFKYAIYSLLAYDAWLFFLVDIAASAQTFSVGITWRNVVEAYSATIDTLAWVILLIMFELETAIIPDDKLQGSLKWLLSGLRLVCYVFISYAFYGYIVKYGVVTNLLPVNFADICSLVSADFTYVQTLDEYLPLTPEACSLMQGQPILQIGGTQIVGTLQQMELAKSLALTDIINAGDWLIVVAILEGEVWLQLKNMLSGRLLAVNKILKSVLYTILFGCAVYWGIDGDFLDFWDAFLWLVAFVFIEMNIFEWHAEAAPATA